MGYCQSNISTESVPTINALLLYLKMPLNFYAGVSSISRSDGLRGKHPLLEPAPLTSPFKRSRPAESTKKQQQFGSTRKELFAGAEKEFSSARKLGLTENGGIWEPGGERKMRWSEEEKQRVAQLLVSKEMTVLGRVISWMHGCSLQNQLLLFMHA